MSSRVTIVTVAEEAGVSTSTVSQVMRGSGRISAKTREKVLEAAKRINYQRDHHAAALRSKQFKEIGLLINQLSNPFNAAVVAGVSNRLETEGYLVFVLDTHDEEERQRRYIDTLIGGARGGLLWVPTVGTSDDLIDQVIARNLPTVTFLRQLPKAKFDHVGIENKTGTFNATQYLIKLGHKKIAFLGGEDRVDVRRQRVAGFADAMSQYTLKPVSITPCRETKTEAADAMVDILKKHPQITAVVCSGDMVAMGATLGLGRMGKTAGDDVSIIGFDGTEEAALWTPSLSTLTVDAFYLGEQLAQTLLERIAKPGMPLKNISLSARLDIRKTTSAPKAPSLS